MAEKSAIEWTDATFNPWIGCTRVGPGCDHCYAATQDGRRHWTPEGWGGPRRRTAEATWKLPTLWNKQPFCECADCGWRGESREASVKDGAGVTLICPRCDHVGMRSVRRRVFCASLADVFDNQVPIEWLRDLCGLIELTPNLDWLLLTKRIGNVFTRLIEARSHDWLAGQPNVWLGVTVVNQVEADRDIPKLLDTPARVRFLSMEPLLGPVDLTDLVQKVGVGEHHFSALECDVDEADDEWGGATVDWVIAGGESGYGARPAHPDWFRSLRDQCAVAGVPFLFKQWGEWMPIGQQGHGDAPGCSDFPGYANARRCVLQLDGEVRDAWPVGAMLMRRIGKKAAGRLLDGITHDGFPDA